MPTTQKILSEKEIKLACLHWIQSACPTPEGAVTVRFSVDRPVSPNPTDPGNGITATVTVPNNFGSR